MSQYMTPEARQLDADNRQRDIAERVQDHINRLGYPPTAEGLRNFQAGVKAESQVSKIL